MRGAGLTHIHALAGDLAAGRAAPATPGDVGAGAEDQAHPAARCSAETHRRPPRPEGPPKMGHRVQQNHHETKEEPLSR